MESLFRTIKNVIKPHAPLSKPRIQSNFRDLPSLDVSYPHNEIKVQYIAPLDTEMRALLSTFFPSGVKNNKENMFISSTRPRSLSLQPGYPGIVDWNKGYEDVAYAMSISLYEEATRQGACVGDPIADCCAVICTSNYVIMVCADGCGWGDAPKKAARIAVLSMLQSLTRTVLGDVYTSQEVFEYLCKGINAVQKGLIESGGTGLTTLCATVIAPSKDHTFNSTAEEKWVVCNVRVGDTATYRYNQTSKELSTLSHGFVMAERDLQDAGGCLGPAVGHKPDLGNLQYSLSVADCNCTVFLATDGVSDNFNPYVTTQLSRPQLQCSDFKDNGLLHKVYCSCLNDDSLIGNSCDLDCIPKHKDLEITDNDRLSHDQICDSGKSCGNCETSDNGNICPTLIEILSLKYFQQTITQYYEDMNVGELVLSICRILAESTTGKRTAMKRYTDRIDDLTREEQTTVNKSHRKYLKSIPGKLDHASIVAVNLDKMKGFNRHSVKAGDTEIQYRDIENLDLGPRTEGSNSWGFRRKKFVNASLASSSSASETDQSH